MGTRARFVLALGLALWIGAAAILVFWPGVAMYDTVAQYGQVISGDYDDWHPPIMARLWALLHSEASGTGPMLVLQMLLYATGFGVIAGTLAGLGRVRAAGCTLLLAGSPLLLGWQLVVLKDTQMLGATLGGVGLIATYRLRSQAVPWWAVCLATVLLGYALLVRANACFAMVPLIVFSLPRPFGLTGKLAVTAVATLAVLAAAPLINHRLLGAEATDVAKSQPLFDLAGIAVRTAGADVGLTPAERAQVIARHCSKPFFWDPLGDEGACAGVMGRLHEQPTGLLYRELAKAAITHPIAYAAQRLEHWNSTERWLVPAGLPSAAPPLESEPNDEGLASPANPLARPMNGLAAAEAGTPLGWPILWTLLAAIMASIAWPRRAEATGNIALALAASALCMEASFLVISIASDLRYHLWPIAASGLAIVLILDGRPIQRRTLVRSGLFVLAVLASGLATRATMPRAPATYRAMIQA